MSLISIRFPRGIAVNGGLVIPDCVLEESGHDELAITEHPVEFGTTIADHAFKKPREVQLRWSWTNSSFFHPYETFVLDMYNTLLAIQSARQPFTLYTGKSAYRNMLIQSISQTTNAGSEYALNTTIVCKEVIITYTTSAPPPQASQADPKNTTALSSTGDKQASFKGNDFGDPITSTTQFPGDATATV